MEKNYWSLEAKNTYSSDDEYWIYNACINFLDDMSFGYIEGYKKAAEILADYIFKSGDSRGEIDYLIYPIIFLYHHQIELRLKELIRLALLFQEKEPEPELHHDIKKLWIKGRKLIEEIYGQSEDCEQAEKIILDIANLDQSSQGFRYPLNRNHVKNLADTTHINLRTFMIKTGGLTQFLCDIGLDLKVKIKEVT